MALDRNAVDARKSKGSEGAAIAAEKRRKLLMNEIGLGSLAEVPWRDERKRVWELPVAS